MDRTVITGYSSISPFGEDFQKLYSNGNASFMKLGQVASTGFGDAPVGVVEDKIFSKYIEERERLKFDRISMMVTHVIKELIERAGIANDPEALENTGIISGSGFGSVMSSAVMLHELYDKGHEGIDPMKFPHTSHNYPISIGAIKYKIKGPITAIIAANGAGFTALSFAKDLIESGSAPRIIVVGVDEMSAHLYKYLLDEDYIGKSQNSEDTYSNGNAIVCEGCVGILLESRLSAQQRNAEVYCEITSGTVTNGGRSVNDAKILNNLKRTLDKASLQNNEVNVYVRNNTGIVEDKQMEDLAIGKLDELGYHFIHKIGLKPVIGNYLGASGLMELAFILQELKNGGLHINREEKKITPGVSSCMVTNYGLGGNICSFIFSRHLN